jgi:Tfp pilus assembly protein PilF
LNVNATEVPQQKCRRFEPLEPASLAWLTVVLIWCGAMSAVKTQFQTSATAPARWIFGPVEDLAFVLATPALILGIFAAARRGAWMDGLLTFMLVLAMAHYFPGILRAYGDQSLFRRFRVRLIAAPIFLLTVTGAFAYLNLHIALLLALLWGQWHWMMQVYGFARIYDAKANHDARTPAWLDRSLCLLWFGMCVFVINHDLASYLTRFYESGGPRIPPESFLWFRRAWIAITVALSAVYVVRMIRLIKQGGRPNPLKIVFIAVTFIYLSYTAGVMERPLVGLALFESWHDIQYLAIVWIFNLNRNRQTSEAGPVIRFLFQPRAVLILLYVAACLAFGSLTHAWTLFKDDRVIRVAISLVTAIGMLHYYMDSFIWKIRETETGQALGVQSGAPAARAPLLIPAWGRHAAMWLLFAIPAGLFFIVESKGRVAPPLEIYENVVAAFPDSASAHYQIARELQDMGRFREARTHYEATLALAPNMLPAHAFLGVLLSDQGEFAAAKDHFERALAADPKNAEVHNNLGIILDEVGDLPNAKTHLDHAIALAPDYALAHANLGITLAKLGEAKGAMEHLETALRLDPGQYMAHNSLGELLFKEGKGDDAKSHFEQALQIDPDYAPAKRNLAAIDRTNSATAASQ